jgi:hypothetical protein
MLRTLAQVTMLQNFFLFDTPGKKARLFTSPIILINHEHIYTQITVEKGRVDYIAGPVWSRLEKGYTQLVKLRYLRLSTPSGSILDLNHKLKELVKDKRSSLFADLGCKGLPMTKHSSLTVRSIKAGNTKGESITVPLTSCLTGLD